MVCIHIGWAVFIYSLPRGCANSLASCRGLGQRDPNHLEVPQNPTLTRDLEDIMLITQEEQEGPRKQRA